MKQVSTNRKPKSNLNPRISVNKLGEYITCGPARRQGLLHDQKFPTGFVVPRYRQAVDWIAQLLVQGPGVYESAVAQIQLEVAYAKSSWEREKGELTLAAVTSFRYKVMPKLLERGNFKATRIPETIHASLMIEGTQVSVRPDFVIEWGDRKKYHGFLKLSLSKTHPLSQNGAEIIGVVLKRYAEETAKPAQKFNHRGFLVADVFDGAVYEAPASQTNRMKDVEAACAEISRLWNTVTQKKTG